MITDACIITSASNKFFPSVINLIGSIKRVSADHPMIYVYDLGLFWSYRKELENTPGVRVVDMPHFVPFWRACYTWKTSIFVHPFAKLNFYLDAGTQVLRPLDEIFAAIDRDGYFAVYQGVKNELIVPKEYLRTFAAPAQMLDEYAVTGGIFGFKKDGVVQKQLDAMYAAASAGYCLGFSKDEQWKSKGVNKTDYVRDCLMFRHDTTLLNIFIRKDNPSFHAHDVKKYGGWLSPHDHPEQIIWNVRMNYKTLDHLDAKELSEHPPLIAYVNRLFIYTFLWGRRASRAVRPQGGGDALARLFGMEHMDRFHDYGDPYNNARYYHRLKGRVVKKFIEENAGQEKTFLDAGAGRGPYASIARYIYKKIYCFEYEENELRAAERIFPTEAIWN